MKRWLKRLAWLVLAVVVVIVLVMIAPVGRYVGLAIEDDTLAKAERVRLSQPTTPVPASAAEACLEGSVTSQGSPAAKVAVSAGHHRRPQELCSRCLEGCDCDAAIEAKLALPTHEFADDDLLGTTTDEQGAFRLCGLWPGELPIRVWAEGPGETSDVVSILWPTSRRVRLELRAPVNLVGRVVDDDGVGLADAKVVVVSTAGGPGVTTSSDAQGSFAARTPPGVTFVLASARGHRPGSVKTVAGTTAVMVELKAEFEAFITVLDGEKPVVGAEVRASDSQRVATTNAAGVAHFARLGKDRLIARAPGRIGVLQFAPATLPLPSGVAPQGALLEPAHFTIQVGPAVVLRGVVTRDGAPVTGAEVTMVGERRTIVKTGADGAFSSEPQAAGSVRLEVKDDRCQQSREYLLDAADLDVEVALECDGGLRGQVVTRQGKVLDGAEVRARCSDSTHDAVTDRFGHFALWPSPGLCQLSVIDSRIAVLHARATSPSSDVVLVGDEGASLRGRVVDEQGHPLAAANVIVFEEMLSQAVATGLKDNGRRWRAHAETAEHGEFEVGGLSAARYRVAVGRGRSATPAFSSSIVLLPAQALDVGTIVAALGVTISGRVIDEQGQPIIGASVRANEGLTRSEEAASISQAAVQALVGDFSGAVEHLPLRASTDVFGRYTLEQAGAVTTLAVSAENYEPQTVRVSRHDGLDVVLKALPRVTVRGRVVDGLSHQPVPAFTVDEASFQDPQGRFSYTGSVSAGGGRSSVFVAADKHRGLSVPVARAEVAEVDLGEVALDPEDEARTIVRVHASGAPVANASVHFLVDGEVRGSGGTDSLGTAVVEHTGGAGTFEVTAAGYTKKSVPVEAMRADLDVELVRWDRTVAGRAIGLDGKGAVGQTVTLGDSTATVGDDGRFSLEHVAADATELRLETPEATWGRVLEPGQNQADIGVVDGEGVVELTLSIAGPFGLSAASVNPTDVKQVFDAQLEGTFVTAPMLPAGTWRFSAPPGQWSVWFVPFNERGLTALIHQLRLSPTTIEVRRGETVRLTLD